MKKYAILVIGYNRLKSIIRLLESLDKAYYDEEITLIISIDNSGSDVVEKYAKDFKWVHGEKIVKTYPERLGLRKHILQCGEFLNDYDALAVFEDDVVASQTFYQYMKCCVDKYYNDDRIAGISLYNHLWNVNVSQPFTPSPSAYDVYFMQYAQSWGQIWMKRQWKEFIQWYQKNDEEFLPQKNIPNFVSSWPKSSWLKYHIKFCIENNKFFVYPYKSLSTCFSDVGEHCGVKDTRFQVPLLTGKKDKYLLPDLSDADAVKYDAFFERIFNQKTINGICKDEVCIDIYGNKNDYYGKRYVLTSKNLPFKCVNDYAFDMKPHEENFINNIRGTGLFLYDTTVEEKISRKNNETMIFQYQFRLYGKRKSMVNCIKESIINRFKRGK